MQYLGAPYVWGSQLLMDNISIISPNAAITANNVTYWMGADKFYIYNGRVDVLPCTLWQYVFISINKEQAWQVVCGSNEGFSEIWWHYASAGSTVNDSYVVYNYSDRVWYKGQLNRTAWQDSALQMYPMAAFSMQVSYLDVALGSSATSITVLNGAGYPVTGTLTLDSEQITYTGRSGNTFTGCTRGANSTTAASHTQYTRAVYSVTNTLLYHEASVDDEASGTATAITSYVESSDFDIGDGHNFGFVWRMIPDVNFNGSTATSPVVTFTLKPRVAPGANYGTSATPTVTRTSTVPVDQYTEQVFVRLRARQMSIKVGSTALGVAWQLGAPRLDVRMDGRKA